MLEGSVRRLRIAAGVNSRLRPAELGAVTFWMNAVWSGEVRHDAIGTVRDHPKGVYRSVLKRAIRSVLIGSPDASDSQVCDGLDELDIPSDTGGKGDRTFRSAYRDPKRRANLQSSISKVRGDMRQSGLLKWASPSPG